MKADLQDPVVQKTILALQQAEITERDIYERIAGMTADPHNREVLRRIAEEEYSHYLIWKQYTGTDVCPDRVRVIWFTFLARTFGITFTFRLMERIEQRAQQTNGTVLGAIPEAETIVANEEKHEQELLGMLDEERLRYMGSVVLGLNDALVEFTGTLAGLTFALQNTKLIAVTGLVMGAAASLSMAASEYLSQRTDETESGSESTSPLKASVYTGTTYVGTVILLILPFLVFENPYVALPITLASAILVILCFTFYISVAKSLSFWRRFAEMAAISLGVAGISFLIGLLIRIVLHVDA